MKKEISIWIGITALVLSITSICISAWRSPELSFDYQGVLVGVLSLLVTVILGWNIYTVIDIKNTRGEIYKLKGLLEKQIQQSNENTILILRMEMIDSAEVLNAFTANEIPDSLVVMFKEFCRIKNENSIAKMLAQSYITQALIGFIKKNNNVITDGLIMQLSERVKIEEVEDFIHYLSSLPDERKPQLLDELFSLLHRLTYEILKRLV